MKKQYIILEIIPTAIKNGEIVQLSALKISNNEIIDRFDYRISSEKVNNLDLLMMTSYDKDNFTYVKTTKKMKIDFKKWIEDLDLLIIDNIYTENYLKNIKNNKESVFKYLNLLKICLELD